MEQINYPAIVIETNNMDKEINVQELLQATQNQRICVCLVGEPRPVWSQGACGQVYSCAMSYIPVINGITGKTANLPNLQGCCAVINLPPVMSKL